MKRMVARRIFTWAALRWPSQRASVTDEPRFQASSLKGPVPTGWVLLVPALLGSTMTAVPWPSWNSRSGLLFFSVSTTVCSSGVAMDSMLANTALSLLTLSLATARSKENLTLDALKGSPFWNLTPLRSLKV